MSVTVWSRVVQYAVEVARVQPAQEGRLEAAGLGVARRGEAGVGQQHEQQLGVNRGRDHQNIEYSWASGSRSAGEGTTSSPSTVICERLRVDLDVRAARRC